MTDNFDLQGWMRKQKQGPYIKTKINESIGGMMTYNPIGSLKDESSMDEVMGHDLDKKWEAIPVEEKEEILDSVDFSEEGLADYAYMSWKMIPEEVREAITDKVAMAKITEPEEDEDEKIAKLASKNVKKGDKMIKGLNPDKDIHDLIYGDDEDDLY